MTPMLCCPCRSVELPEALWPGQRLPMCCSDWKSGAPTCKHKLKIILRRFKGNHCSLLFSETPSRVVEKFCTALCATLCASFCAHKDGRKHVWFEDAIKAKCRETCRLRHVRANHWLVYPKPNKAQQFDAGLSEGATKPKCLEKYWSERKREIQKSKLNTQCKPWQCTYTPWHVHAKHGLHHWMAHCHHLLHACMSPRALG